MPQPADPREQRLTAGDLKPADSILEGREREKRFREESERIKAQQAEQEDRQRKRAAWHREQAMLVDAQTQEAIGRRIFRALEEAKLQSQPQEPPVSLYTERQETELELEQAAGRRALEKYARRQT